MSCKKKIITYNIENIHQLILDKPNDPGLYMNMLKEIVEKKYDYKLCLTILNILIEHKSLKWRHLKTTISYLKTHITDFDEYYRSHFKPHVNISSIMILDIANLFPYLLKYYIGKYIDIEPKLINHNNYDINVYHDLNDLDNSYDELINNIQRFIMSKYKTLNYFMKFIPQYGYYDIAIDGNNILLETGNITKKSYYNLKHIYKVCSDKSANNVIVFIHKRHMKKLKTFDNTIPFNYIATPYGYNDDWFTL